MKGNGGYKSKVKDNLKKIAKCTGKDGCTCPKCKDKDMDGMRKGGKKC